MTDTLSALARPLASVAQALWRPVRRVYQERQAGQMPFGGGNDLLAQGLNETMSRLRGGNVDDAWWQNLLTRIGHEFVAPDFLRKPALQEWLADEEVQRDTKALARARVMGADTDDPEAWMRLRRAYAHNTGEHERLADGPIDVVLAVLAAGYLASISPSLQPLAGMIQASAQESRDGFERMEEQLSTIHRGVEELGPNACVVQILSERAEHELSLLLKQRSLSPDRVRQELIVLAQRVTEGDFHHVKHSVRAEVQYWTARGHATQAETLVVARRYLQKLFHTNPGADARIVDALILETEGDIDDALRILRDVDTPDGRATFFRTLFSRRGAETAMLWFDNQSERDNAGFLTGLGWCIQEEFPRPDGNDTYELLPLFAKLVLNRINSLDGGALEPPCWKRMCAWMQAGFLVRLMQGISLELGSFREWIWGHQTLAGEYEGARPPP